MALRKFATALLIVILAILPIVPEARLYHGYDSYRQYHESTINGGHFINPIASEETAEESYHDRTNVKGKMKSRFNGDNLESGFIFPDDGLQTRYGGGNDAKNVIGQATSCDDRKQTFCEDVPNYPEEFVNQALAKNSSLLHYAHEDVILIVPRVDADEEPLCLSMERVIRPKTGLNLKNEWRYILQSNQSNFHQSIRIEICQEVNTRCRIIDGFAEGYLTTCKQKYIYRELSAISENGEIVLDYFRFPASCCCHVQFTGTSQTS